MARLIGGFPRSSVDVAEPVNETHAGRRAENEQPAEHRELAEVIEAEVNQPASDQESCRRIEGTNVRFHGGFGVREVYPNAVNVLRIFCSKPCIGLAGRVRGSEAPGSREPAGDPTRILLRPRFAA
jgi:hypothetical protein